MANATIDVTQIQTTPGINVTSHTFGVTLSNNNNGDDNERMMASPHFEKTEKTTRVSGQYYHSVLKQSIFILLCYFYNCLPHYYHYPLICWICDLLLFSQNALIKNTGVSLTLTVV